MPNVKAMGPYILAVLGFACARFSTTVGVSGGLVDHSPVWIGLKLAKALVYILLAVIFQQRDFRKHVGKVSAVAFGLLLVLEATYCSMELVGVNDSSLALFYIAAGSANDALVTFAYLMLMAFSGCGPLLLFSGFAANYLLWIATSGLGAEVAIWAEIVTRALGAAGLVYLSYRSTKGLWQQAEDATPPAHAFDKPRVFALAGVGLALSTVAGYYLSIPFDVNALALEGNLVNTLSTLLCAGLAVLCCLSAPLFSSSRSLYPAITVCLVGCFLIPAGDSEALAPYGVLCIRLGRLMAELCLWALAMHAVLADERTGAFGLAVILAACTYYVGTPIAMATGEMVASSNYGLTYSALFAATLTCCCFTVVAALRKHVDETTPVTRFMPEDSPESTLVNEKLAAFDQKLTRFIAQKNLTAREQDILIELVHGHSGEAIGERLGYSRDSVKFSLTKLYSKTGVSSKQELINAIEQTRR